MKNQWKTLIIQQLRFRTRKKVVSSQFVFHQLSSARSTYKLKKGKNKKKFALMAELENINPNIYKKTDERSVSKAELDENVVDPIDEREIFGKLL